MQLNDSFKFSRVCLEKMYLRNKVLFYFREITYKRDLDSFLK